MKCDRCGEEYNPDDVGYMSFTFYGPSSYAGSHTVLYEWWSKGNYCKECCDKVFDLFCTRLGIAFPERYEGTRNDDALMTALDEMPEKEDK